MAYFFPAAIVSTPSLIKDGTEGWITRLIFSHNIPEELNLGQDYFHIVDSNLVRGNKGYFPPNYWSTGRILRLKASFMYTSYGGGAFLNIRFGMNDGSNSFMAYSDNEQNHIFAGSNQAIKVPVKLEITVVYVSNGNFGIDGFYQYEWGSYSSGGDNGKVVFVPITFNGGGLDITTATNLELFIENEPTQIMWMTIEELG